MKYDREKHRRRSVRLRGYDYAQTGAYFVTICTWQKECMFGDIFGGEMLLNEYGGIVDECIKQIPDHIPNVEIHCYVVMPNHVNNKKSLFQPVLSLP